MTATNRGFSYPARLEADVEGYKVTFPDLPSAVTWGANKDEAMEMPLTR